MTVHWTHLTTMATDLDRSIEFYKGFRGLSVVKDRRLEGGSTVWLGPEPQAGEFSTFVLVLMRGEVVNRLDHLGFQCDSRGEVDAIAGEAERLGILESIHRRTAAGASAIGRSSAIRMAT